MPDEGGVKGQGGWSAESEVREKIQKESWYCRRLLARIPRTSTGVAGRGEGGGEGGDSGPTGTCIKITAPFSAGGGQHFCRRCLLSPGCFQRELNVRPRARARKPENRREEDENGIRETVGGEEAGKAGSRFRRGWVRAFAADRKRESERAI